MLAVPLAYLGSVLFGLYGIFAGIAAGNALTAVVAWIMSRRILDRAEADITDVEPPAPVPSTA